MKLSNVTQKGITVAVGYDDANNKIPRWKGVDPGETIELDNVMVGDALKMGLVPIEMVEKMLADAKKAKEPPKPIDVGPPKIEKIKDAKKSEGKFPKTTRRVTKLTKKVK